MYHIGPGGSQTGSGRRFALPDPAACFRRKPGKPFPSEETRQSRLYRLPVGETQWAVCSPQNFPAGSGPGLRLESTECGVQNQVRRAAPIIRAALRFFQTFLPNEASPLAVSDNPTV